TVHVDDNDACGLVSKVIKVEEPEQLVSMFTFPNTPYDVSTSAVVNFTNMSSANATDFYWNFGDGQSIQGIANPVHEYTTPGSFEVKLSAINQGCSDTSSKTIEVIQSVGLNEIGKNGNFVVRQSNEKVWIDFNFAN